jgi:hypothetical protein
MSRLSRRQQWLCDIIIVHLVGAVGMLLALQGWKSRIVNLQGLCGREAIHFSMSG